MTDDERARYATQIVTNPLWADILRDMKEDAVVEWETSLATDTVTRERCYLTRQALTKIEQHVNGLVRK